MINAEQVFSAYEAARGELASRYARSMSWKAFSGATYPYRKVNRSNRSLGVRSPESENAHRAFHEASSCLRNRVVKLTARLDEIAPAAFYHQIR